MKITLLGTGNAVVTKCYNTCFVMDDGTGPILVDGGGGSGLLAQLEKAGIRWQDISSVIVTHKHIDHLLGIIWMMRLILQGTARGKYHGQAAIYGHDQVIASLLTLADMLLTPKETKYIGSALRFITVEDGEKVTMNDREVTFFDIGSTKEKQFGFCLRLCDGRKVTCCGDEPYCDREFEYAVGSYVLLHEAFCLYAQADIFEPYKKNHSTAKDAAELAEKLGAQNLILYHTEDKNIANRKALYTAEGKAVYSGNLFVPDDLEVLEF